MRLIVHNSQRLAKMRAHTATHLLHFALDQILGGTRQAGSLVDDDYLRFDFASKKPLHAEQINIIQQYVNTWIYEAHEVHTQEMSYEEATASGAKAFFEDKYGDTVRVVSIGNNDTQTNLTSVELCGGTHTRNTAHIGSFVITEQSAVASGIRRIVAYTGPKVVQAHENLTQQVIDLSTMLDCQPKQLQNKLQKTIKDHDVLKREYESMQTTIIQHTLEKVTPSTHNHRDMVLDASNISENHSFKTIVTLAKTVRSDKNRAVYTKQGNFALGTHATSTVCAKAYAKEHGLSGGGSEHLVQGRDTGIIALMEQV